MNLDLVSQVVCALRCVCTVQHLLKKIRNNLFRSGYEKWHTQKLMCYDEISKCWQRLNWQTIETIYEVQQAQHQPTLQRLTAEAVNLTSKSCMRGPHAAAVMNYEVAVSSSSAVLVYGWCPLCCAALCYRTTCMRRCAPMITATTCAWRITSATRCAM